MAPNTQLIRILVVVTPNFNLAATTAFIDPFRATNYLEGLTRFRWTLASAQGGACLASNGMAVQTEKLASVEEHVFEIVVISASWTPETASYQLGQRPRPAHQP